MMQKHFVHFYSPGTFVSEENVMTIEAWDPKLAAEMARGIKQRHGTTPYGFRFSTRTRGDDDLDSKVVARSSFYFLGGKVETLAEIELRNDPSEDILRGNLRNNGHDRIIVNTNSWKFTAPLGKDDVVLDWTP